MFSDVMDDSGKSQRIVFGGCGFPFRCNGVIGRRKYFVQRVKKQACAFQFNVRLSGKVKCSTGEQQVVNRLVAGFLCGYSIVEPEKTEFIINSVMECGRNLKNKDFIFPISTGKRVKLVPVYDIDASGKESKGMLFEE